jgi:molecular chaperone GrpE
MSDDETVTAPAPEPEEPQARAAAQEGSDKAAADAGRAGDASATQLQPATPDGDAPPDELQTLRRQCSDLRDQLLRRRADFENYRKRVERERGLAAVDAEAALLKELLPTVDNMELALVSAAEDDPLREGLALIHRELAALFSRLGVVVHSPVGLSFDPETDEALVHDHAPGVPDGHVVEVLRKGYLFKERLLRPAWVKVAKGEPSAEDLSPSSDGETVH